MEEELAKRTASTSKKRKPSPIVHVVNKTPKIEGMRPVARPSAAPVKKPVDYDFLFGQGGLSPGWTAARGKLKEKWAEIMNDSRPSGSTDYEDWLKVGRAVGQTIDHVIRSESPAPADEA